MLQSLGSHSNTFSKYSEGYFPSSFSLYTTDLSWEGIWLAPSSKEAALIALGTELQYISPLHPRGPSPDLKGLWVEAVPCLQYSGAGFTHPFFQAEGSVDSCAPTSNSDRTQHSLRLILLQGYGVRSRPPLQLLWKTQGEKQDVGI